MRAFLLIGIVRGEIELRKFFVAVLAVSLPIAAAQAEEVAPDASGWAAFESEGGLRDVATGAAHTCAVSARGRVWCWGSNWYGQLGDGTTTARRTPVQVADLRGEFQAVAAGGNHSCALSTAGAVFCWGRNEYGQLGIGSTTDSPRPERLRRQMRSGVQAIVAGHRHTCALSSNGVAFCWGLNLYGQVGDGSTASRTLPTRVAGLGANARSISAGMNHSCGLDRNGRAMCWGDNRLGQIGDGTTTRRTVATPVEGVTRRNSRMIVAASSHSCLLNRAQRVFCWGNNDNGQLGNGTTTYSPEPVRVPRFRRGGVETITAGGAHYAANISSGFSCATNQRGALMCWGANRSGQLGDGTTERRLRPVRVMRLRANPRMAVAGNGAHICAVPEAGHLLCWGANSSGALGDDSTQSSSAPVRVRGMLHRR